MSPNFALIFSVPTWNDPPVKIRKTKGTGRFTPPHLFATHLFAIPCLVFALPRALLRYKRFGVSAVFPVSAAAPHPRNPINFNVTGNLR
jgi:hypothetical protein